MTCILLTGSPHDLCLFLWVPMVGLPLMIVAFHDHVYCFFMSYLSTPNTDYALTTHRKEDLSHSLTRGKKGSEYGQEIPPQSHTADQPMEL